MNEVFSYRNLNAYQQAKQLVVLIYALLKQFPKEEQYSLCDQLRRAVISIPSKAQLLSGLRKKRIDSL